VSALDAFVENCARAPLDRQPVVWCSHGDIWEKARGEIGVPEDLAHPLEEVVFAALIPLVIVAEIKRADLIIDLRELEAPRLIHTVITVDSKGLDVDPRSVGYEIDDRGRWRFVEPKRHGGISPAIMRSISLAITSRMDRYLWDEDLTYDEALEVSARIITKEDL